MEKSRKKMVKRSRRATGRRKTKVKKTMQRSSGRKRTGRTSKAMVGMKRPEAKVAKKAVRPKARPRKTPVAKKKGGVPPEPKRTRPEEEHPVQVDESELASEILDEDIALSEGISEDEEVTEDMALDDEANADVLDKPKDLRDLNDEDGDSFQS